MTKPRRIGLFLGLLLIVAALIYTATRSREPEYQGKKLSAWLAEINFGYSPQTSGELQTALRAMGTNTLPFLLPRLRSENSTMKLTIQNWAQKQNFILRFHDRDQDSFAAIVAFQVLGPTASPAIPALEKMLNEEESHYAAVIPSLQAIGKDAVPALTNTWSHPTPEVRMAGFRALVEMGTNAETAVPFLAFALNDADSETRRLTASAMWSVGRSQPAIAIPVLTKTLDDPVAGVQVAAIRALEGFRSRSQAAVPKLTGFLEHRQLAGHAVLALARIMGTNESIPVVTGALTKQDAVVQEFLIDSLATFQSEAREAVPSLLPFAKSENKRLRASAIRALIKIGVNSELMVPVLIQELVATESAIRGYALEALAGFGPDAKAAVPVLLERIEVINKFEGQFPGATNPQMVTRGFDRYRPLSGTALPVSPPFLEFDVLRKIDPAAADQIKKRLEREKANRVPKNSPAP